MTDVLSLRPRLFGIAYRILGTIADAEDVVQSVAADDPAAETTRADDLAIGLRSLTP